jgi:hypothetical protein
VFIVILHRKDESDIYSPGYSGESTHNLRIFGVSIRESMSGQAIFVVTQNYVEVDALFSLHMCSPIFLTYEHK